MIIFIGETPEKIPEGKTALDTLAGRRLAKLLNIPWSRFKLHARLTINVKYHSRKRLKPAQTVPDQGSQLFEDPAPPNGRGDVFDLLETRKQVQEIRKVLDPSDVIFLLGRSVQTVFGYKPTPGKPIDVIQTSDIGLIILLPHPSGANRLWNNRQLRVQVMAVYSAATTNQLT
jgi:hypothetical protein